MMRKKLLGIAAVLSAIIIAAGVAMAADNQATVGASATIDAVTSLGVEVKAIADDSTQDELKFSTVTETYQKAQDYLEVTAESNYGFWSIEIYTDNWASAPSTTTWGYQYGGLLGAIDGNRLGLGWCAFDTPFDDEPTGDPGAENRWSFVKDKADANNPDVIEDTSWGARGGYATIAYGGGDEAWVINPNMGEENDYKEELTSMPIYVYLETAGAANPDTYAGTIGFDLIHE